MIVEINSSRCTNFISNCGNTYVLIVLQNFKILTHFDNSLLGIGVPGSAQNAKKQQKKKSNLKFANTSNRSKIILSILFYEFPLGSQPVSDTQLLLIK